MAPATKSTQETLKVVKNEHDGEKKESCRRRPLPFGSSESETPAKKAPKSFPIDDVVKEEPIDNYPTTTKVPEISKSTEPMIIDSNIVRSELHNVVISNCRIEKCQIFDSKIFGTLKF
ncbi:hypothetical protein B9Z55_003428 [Caenorhabditis nigoni]|nr:hypothetical protein B9Z55_003428 [Caenorhabditis nigoni]